MKTGRNDPCPCGSGKKYKKCCYLTGQNRVPGEFLKLINTHDDDDDLYDDVLFEEEEEKEDYDRESLTRALINIHSFILENKPHIKEYYKIRKLHGEVVNTMVQYHEDGKFEKRICHEPIFQGEHPQDIQVFNLDFDLGDRTGVQAFYDWIIYKHASNINCITEDFIQKQRYRKPGKMEFLQSMLDAKLGLFEITKLDEDEGYVYLREVFTGAEHKIVDIALSATPNFEDTLLYTRIITYHGISFGTGLNIVFMKTGGFIKSFIERHKKDYRPDGEIRRFSELYNHFTKDPDRVKSIVNSL